MFRTAVGVGLERAAQGMVKCLRRRRRSPCAERGGYQHVVVPVERVPFHKLLPERDGPPAASVFVGTYLLDQTIVQPVSISRVSGGTDVNAPSPCRCASRRRQDVAGRIQVRVLCVVTSHALETFLRAPGVCIDHTARAASL